MLCVYHALSLGMGLRPHFPRLGGTREDRPPAPRFLSCLLLCLPFRLGLQYAVIVKKKEQCEYFGGEERSWTA
jgi:hypothetical protein